MAEESSLMWHRGDPLEVEGVARALPRYIDVVRGRRAAKFIISRSYATEFSETDSTEELWRLHSELLRGYYAYESEYESGKGKAVNRSFLDLKVELAKRVMGSCRFCERRCGVDRLTGGVGYCGAGREFAVASSFLHTGEEPELVPSGTVFTSGCTIRCLHCQNYDISQWLDRGTPMGPERMADLVSRLQSAGCRNLNMVGGEPTPNTWLWLDTSRHIKDGVAAVWNSNSWYSEETAELLAGFIDLYLLDFKYGNDSCASAISDAPRYWATCTRNHLAAKENGELLIRVLVLPGHNGCCTRPILEWIAGNLGPWTRVNLMFQYHPEWRAGERPELSRRLSKAEKEEAERIAVEVGLRNLV